jgi:hypothetical protein
MIVSSGFAGGAEMTIVLKSIISGLMFLIAISTGILLSRSGRPLAAAIFTVHKLTALGAAVFAALIVADVFKIPDIPSAFLPVAVAGGIFILSLFMTGALLSLEKQANGVALTLHCLSTVLAAISVIAAAYLLLI